MNMDWTPLDLELARWDTAGLMLPVWWRDDDAVTRTPALDRLGDLAERLDIQTHLAVIPALAQDDLATLDARMIPVVHGWAHTSHAPAGEKNVEFGAHRPVATMQAEAESGLTRLRDLFGESLAPMFVPPWNRIDATAITTLPGYGYRMLSTFTPRVSEFAAPGLMQVNTHLDPINWRGGKTLHDPAALIAQVVRQLADRREGRADAAEPYGILTHHLVHDDAIWDFTEQLLTHLLAGPVRRWTAQRET